MTNDDIRRIASEVKRELGADVRVVIDGLQRVEHDLGELKRDVLHLMNDKIKRDARDEALAGAARKAAELVAEKAETALVERQWSVRKWTTIIGAVATAMVAITTLTSLLGQYLFHAPPAGP